MMIPNATLDSRDPKIVMFVSVRQRRPFRERAIRKQPPTAHTRQRRLRIRLPTMIMPNVFSVQ